MDTQALLDQIARGAVVAVIPTARTPDTHGRVDSRAPDRRWYSMREVADMLGFGLNKVKTLVITGEMRSVKIGKYRRILPEWVDEYVQRRTSEAM